jgi:hypothetical protein
MARGDKPVRNFKHRGISASIFENTTNKDGAKQTFYRVNLRRTYKQNDEFVSNSNFGRDDIPIARLLLDRAWQWIIDAEINSPNQRFPSDDNPFDDPPKKKVKVRS